MIVGSNQMEIFTDRTSRRSLVCAAKPIENAPFSEEQLQAPAAGDPDHGKEPSPGRSLSRYAHRRNLHHQQSVANRVRCRPQQKHLPKGEATTPASIRLQLHLSQVMSDKVVPSIADVFVNVHPPNQPSTHRCVEMGQIVARAISGIPDAQVAVFAKSGNLSAFAGRRRLDGGCSTARKNNDERALVMGHSRRPVPLRLVGNEELDQVAGIMMNRGMKMIWSLRSVAHYALEARTSSTGSVRLLAIIGDPYR